MYCIKCGVKLADSEKVCPLCKTPVFHPDLKQGAGEPTYPEFTPPEQKASPKGILFIITCLMLIPLLITLAVDLMTGGGLSWSGYVLGGEVMLYTICILPTWFKRPNPSVFVPVAFAEIALFLWYINRSIGTSWFWTFALPITAAIGLIVTAVAVLCHYLRKGYLYIFGGAFAALGLYCVLIEILVTVTFARPFIFWSLYPCIALFIIAAMLITIAVCRPLRESLERKFFIAVIHSDSGKIIYDLPTHRSDLFKKHLRLLILAASAWLALMIATYFLDFLGEFKAIAGGAVVLLGVLTYGFVNNKASAYAENKVFDEQK